MSNAEVLGRFVWHELMTSDTAAAAVFYPKVLAWRTAPSNMPGYTIWMAGQTQIGGLMAQPAGGGAPPHWLIYVGTPNVDATCTQAQGLGARLCKAPQDIPNVGRFAVLADPQGATFAVFTPAAGAPPPGATPTQGGFSWHELATTDVAAALRFYGELFGWRKGPGHDMGSGRGVYQLFEHAGTQVGGIHAVPGSASAPTWLSYVQVADSSRAVTAAKAAGGSLVHGPMEVPGGSWIAVMTDPQGGAFAVQQQPAIAASQPKGTPPTLKPAAPAKPSAPPKPAAVASKPAPAPAPASKPAPASASKPVPAAKPAATPAATKPAAKPAKKPKPAKKAKKKAKKKTKKKVARKAAKKAARKPVKAKGKSRKSARGSARRSAGRRRRR